MTGSREECEWNPMENRPALATDPPHAEATVCLGAGGAWHVCAECAELPQFNSHKFRVRIPIGSARSS